MFILDNLKNPGVTIQGNNWEFFTEKELSCKGTGGCDMNEQFMSKLISTHWGTYEVHQNDQNDIILKSWEKDPQR